jgi:hypothetical protein
LLKASRYASKPSTNQLPLYQLLFYLITYKGEVPARPIEMLALFAILTARREPCPPKKKIP